jgi:L-lactate dehydrogenase complex protein LldF
MSQAAGFRQRVAAAVADRRLRAAVRRATWQKVQAREASLAAMRNPQELRELAAKIRQHTLARLPDYLEQFVRNAQARGAVIHFAPEAATARQKVIELALHYRSKLAVKVKSMTTEEIALNAALEAVGVEVVETDLGEFIVQIDRDRPSHIVTPIIHKDRRQVADALSRRLGCTCTQDPADLTRVARQHLRDVFRRCDLGISGVNFAVAQTGTICICTNEGNGRMCTTRPGVHVAIMGIEKVIPRLCDLAVFLKLLSRSSTGQPLGSYTSLISGPKRPGDPDGPEHLHIILLDNGRSAILSSPFAEVLRCVRCGACLNACPVYRAIGGHAYNSVYPGPIGSVLMPLLDPSGPYSELPGASSLCGACRVACPVDIDIPRLLIRLRAGRRGHSWLKRPLMRLWAIAMRSARAYRLGQWLLKRLLPDDVDGWTVRGPGPLAHWTDSRDLLRPPAKSFRRLWQEGLV